MKSSSSSTLTNYMSIVELMAWLVLLSGEIDRCRCGHRVDTRYTSRQSATVKPVQSATPIGSIVWQRRGGNLRNLGEKYKNHSLVKLHFDHRVLQRGHEHVWVFFQMVKDTFHPWSQLDQLFQGWQVVHRRRRGENKNISKTSEQKMSPHRDENYDEFDELKKDARMSEQLPSSSTALPNFNYDVINVLGHIENRHLGHLTASAQLFDVPITIVSSKLDQLIYNQIFDEASKVTNLTPANGSSSAFPNKNSSGMKFDDKIAGGHKRITRDTESRTSLTFNHKKYNSIEQIYEYLESLEKEVKENSGERKSKINVIGSSYEGQSIYSVEINCYTNRSQKKFNTTHECREKLIVLECGIHAREWISPAVCLWIIDYFSRSKYLVNEKVSFIIVPIVNPDGYRYTWNGERLWRKNRSPVIPVTNDTSGSKCLGVDLNRNFDVHFGEDLHDTQPSASNSNSKSGNNNNNNKVSPCSEVYPGTSAMDQLEVKSLVNYITKLQARGSQIVAYFSIHSYSQLWLYPYGFSDEFAPNLGQLSSLAYKASQAIRSKYGTHYKIASVNDLLYKVTGSSVDYFYMVAGVKIAFAIELPDEGEEGFLLHPRYIEPTALELLCGIEVVIEGLDIG